MRSGIPCTRYGVAGSSIPEDEEGGEDQEDAVEVGGQGQERASGYSGGAIAAIGSGPGYSGQPARSGAASGETQRRKVDVASVLDELEADSEMDDEVRRFTCSFASAASQYAACEPALRIST